MRFVHYIKKYWSEILVSMFILLIIWLLIFYWYPIYLKHLFNYHNPTLDLSHESEGFGRGTFGDMYGALNTFLSGLGMVGLLATILIQISLHNYEKSEKLKVENSKIIFINRVLSKFNDEFLVKFKRSLTKMLTMLDGEIAHFRNFKPDEYDDSLLSVLKKIDFEEYFILFENKGKPGTDLLLLQSKLIELQTIVDNFNIDKDSFFDNFEGNYHNFNERLRSSILLANTSNEDYLKYYASSLQNIKIYLPLLKERGNETTDKNYRNDFNLNFNDTTKYFDKMCELIASYREKLDAYEKIIDKTISYIPSQT